MPIAGVVGAFIIIAPGIMWASNLTARTNAADAQVYDLKSRVVELERQETTDGTRVTILETNYANVLLALSNIQISLEKLQTRFNVR